VPRAAKSPAKLKLATPEILKTADSNLTPGMRHLVADLCAEWKGGSWIEKENCTISKHCSWHNENEE